MFIRPSSLANLTATCWEDKFFFSSSIALWAGTPRRQSRSCVGQVIMWADVDGIRSARTALSGQAVELLVRGATRRMRNAYT